MFSSVKIIIVPYHANVIIERWTMRRKAEFKQAIDTRKRLFARVRNGMQSKTYALF